MTKNLSLCFGASTLVIALAASPALGFDASLMNPYIEFGGGANTQHFTLGNLDANSTNPAATASEVRNLGIGAEFYAALGADLVPGLRAEIQGSFRANSGARFDVSAEGSGSITADMQTFMVLANLWKDFQVSQGVVISVGGGVGVGSTQHTATSGAFRSQTNITGLAYMAGAGVGFDVGSGMLLNFTYSVSGIAGNNSSTVSIDSTDPTDEPFIASLTGHVNQSVTVGLRIPVGN